MKSYDTARERALTLDIHGRKRNRPSKPAKSYRHKPQRGNIYRLEDNIAAYFERCGYSAQF